LHECTLFYQEFFGRQDRHAGKQIEARTDKRRLANPAPRRAHHSNFLEGTEYAA
jgi:hypothetical protein